MKKVFALDRSHSNVSGHSDRLRRQRRQLHQRCGIHLCDHQPVLRDCGTKRSR